MKTLLTVLLLVFLAYFLVCWSDGHRIAGVTEGMTEEQVRISLGEPDSTLDRKGVGVWRGCKGRTWDRELVYEERIYRSRSFHVYLDRTQGVVCTSRFTTIGSPIAH